MSNYQLLCFGDSITFGLWDTCQGGWVERLKNLIGVDKQSIRVFNLGISGENSLGLLNRIENELISRKHNTKASIIVIAIGANDCSFNKETKSEYVSPAQYESNLISIFKYCSTHSQNVVFLQITPVVEARTKIAQANSFYFNNSVKNYNQILENLCLKFGAPFIKFDLGYFNDDDFDIDGLHLSQIGHQKIANKVHNYLQTRFE
jgi:lysophospholipase L1-like esterase